MNPKLKLTVTNAIFYILGHSLIFDPGSGFESVLSEMIFYINEQTKKELKS